MIYGLRRCRLPCRLTRILKPWLLNTSPKHKMTSKSLYGALVAIAIVTIMSIYVLQLRNLHQGHFPSGVIHFQLYPVHTMHGSIGLNGKVIPDGEYTMGGNSGNYSKDTWLNPHLHLLNMEPIRFLPNFKNPCWYEPLREFDVYKNNKYNVVSRSARLTSLKLMQEWSRRLAGNSHAQRLRCLPYFMVIGQPKCGSTDLFQRITRHPSALSPPIKETHWWSRNRQGRNINYTDIIPLSQYVDLFDDVALTVDRRTEKTEEQINPSERYHPFITGEASVSYMWENDDWWRYPENYNFSEPAFTNSDYIHHFLPNLKLIVILRDPVDRLYSDYLYFTKTNKSVEDFDNKVRMGVSVYKNCTEDYSLRRCIYNRTISYLARIRLRVGMYEVYLREWMKIYPREQIYVLRLEDYTRNMLTYINEIYTFLNLHKLSKGAMQKVLKNKIANKRKYKDKKLGKMLPRTRELLEQFYAPFNRRLSRLLKDKRYLWNTVDKDDDSDIKINTYNENANVNTLLDDNLTVTNIING